MFGQPKGRKIPQDPKAKNKLIYGIVIALLMVAALVSGRMRTKQLQSVVRSDAPFQVHILDVGQGDSILVLADGHAMLIDSGDASGGKAAANALGLLGVTDLEYAVTTHLHFDHIGGFAEVCKARKILKVAEPQTPETLLPDDVAYQSYTKAVQDSGAERITLHDGDSFTLGKAQVEVLAPAETAAPSDLNNTSLVLRVQYESAVCLFTGDLEKDEEEALLERHPELKADLLKVGHHGSQYATGEAFLQAVSPQFAAISCGKNNDYGHPSPETLERLKAAGAQVQITAEQGNLAYLYENGALHCVPQRQEGQS
ncbi:MAG: MBL fold metallo-hydrolase [Oscillospiraceae bacterium]|nr:MBL fold metallo-hydrolase [Oscillospiraceae bacterium]